MCSQQDLLYYEDWHYKVAIQSRGSPCRLNWVRAFLLHLMCSDGVSHLCGGSADFVELSGAVSCWRFCRESGRTVKLFCSSAHGIAVDLLQHKSDSSFHGTGNLIFSCFHLFPSTALCEPLECRGLILWLNSRKAKVLWVTSRHLILWVSVHPSTW